MDPTPDRIEAALAGDEPAIRALVDHLLPAIQGRVARVLLRHGAGRDVRGDVEDLTQDVLVRLFAGDADLLRAWRPERGALKTFVALVAERDALVVLRSRRKSPYAADPTPPEDLDPATGSHERRLTAADLLDAVLDGLRAEQSVLGLEMIELLLVEQLDAPEVAARTGQSLDAVYAWRSRLKKRARAIHDDLVSGSDPAPHSPTGRQA